MSGTQLQRKNEAIKKALSDAIAEMKDPRVQGIVSVTHVSVTRDLKYCTVYISVLGSDEQQRSTMAAIKNAAAFLRRELASRVDLRYTPELVLHLDDSISVGARITGILNELKEQSDGFGE